MNLNVNLSKRVERRYTIKEGSGAATLKRKEGISLGEHSKFPSNALEFSQV
jgi:hypothetical protein